MLESYPRLPDVDSGVYLPEEHTGIQISDPPLRRNRHTINPTSSFTCNVVGYNPNKSQNATDVKFVNKFFKGECVFVMQAPRAEVGPYDACYMVNCNQLNFYLADSSANPMQYKHSTYKLASAFKFIGVLNSGKNDPAGYTPTQLVRVMNVDRQMNGTVINDWGSNLRPGHYLFFAVIEFRLQQVLSIDYYLDSQLDTVRTVKVSGTLTQVMPVYSIFPRIGPADFSHTDTFFHKYSNDYTVKHVDFVGEVDRVGSIDPMEFRVQHAFSCGTGSRLSRIAQNVYVNVYAQPLIWFPVLIKQPADEFDTDEEEDPAPRKKKMRKSKDESADPLWPSKTYDEQNKLGTGNQPERMTLARLADKGTPLLPDIEPLPSPSKMVVQKKTQKAPAPPPPTTVATSKPVAAPPPATAPPLPPSTKVETNEAAPPPSATKVILPEQKSVAANKSDSLTIEFSEFESIALELNKQVGDAAVASNALESFYLKRLGSGEINLLQATETFKSHLQHHLRNRPSNVKQGVKDREPAKQKANENDLPFIHTVVVVRNFILCLINLAKKQKLNIQKDDKETIGVVCELLDYSDYESAAKVIEAIMDVECTKMYTLSKHNDFDAETDSESDEEQGKYEHLTKYVNTYNWSTETTNYVKAIVVACDRKGLAAKQHAVIKRPTLEETSKGVQAVLKRIFTLKSNESRQSAALLLMLDRSINGYSVHGVCDLLGSEFMMNNGLMTYVRSKPKSIAQFQIPFRLSGWYNALKTKQPEDLDYIWEMTLWFLVGNRMMTVWGAYNADWAKDKSMLVTDVKQLKWARLDDFVTMFSSSTGKQYTIDTVPQGATILSLFEDATFARGV